MKIIKNPNKETVTIILDALRANDGYCPCKIDHLPQNKCMCEEFRNQISGECHCGLYIKMEE